MKQTFVVTGTDTGIGKTVISAALTDALNACYWKPVQSGLDQATDSETVARLAGISQRRIAGAHACSEASTSRSLVRLAL